MSEKDYTRADEAVLRREARKREQLEARVEAREEAAKKQIANAVRAMRRAVAQELMDATNRRNKRDAIFDVIEKAGGGAYQVDDEVITGEEPRPWED